MVGGWRVGHDPLPVRAGVHGGAMKESLFVVAGTAVFLAACALVAWLFMPDSRAKPSTLACHAAGGWWVAATLDNHGEPKMWACVDDAGRLVLLSEEK